MRVEALDLVRVTGLEPARRGAIEPKSIVSASFTTSANSTIIAKNGANVKRLPRFFTATAFTIEVKRKKGQVGYQEIEQAQGRL